MGNISRLNSEINEWTSHFGITHFSGHDRSQKYKNAFASVFFPVGMTSTGSTSGMAIPAKNAEHGSFDRGAAVTIEITNETESPFVDHAFGGSILERSSIGDGR